MQEGVFFIWVWGNASLVKPQKQWNFMSLQCSFFIVVNVRMFLICLIFRIFGFVAFFRFVCFFWFSDFLDLWEPWDKPGGRPILVGSGTLKLPGRRLWQAVKRPRKKAFKKPSKGLWQAIKVPSKCLSSALKKPLKSVLKTFKSPWKVLNRPLNGL